MDSQSGPSDSLSEETRRLNDLGEKTRPLKQVEVSERPTVRLLPSQPLQPQSKPAAQPKPESKLPRRRRGRFRSWLGGRTGRIVLPSVTLLLGILLGSGGLFLYALSIAGEGKVLVTPLPPSGSDIIVQVGPAYITHLVDRNIHSSNLPGTVSNVRVQLVRGDQMTITGDDQFGVLGVGVTRHFTVIMQPVVSECQLQMHVLHADMGGIPVTGFVATFEGKINQDLKVNPDGLPKGFTYCTVAVRTDPKGMFVTYSAKPV